MKHIMIISLGDKKGSQSYDAPHEASLLASTNDESITLHKLQLNQNYKNITYSKTVVDKEILKTSYKSFHTQNRQNLLKWDAEESNIIEEGSFVKVHEMLKQRDHEKLLAFFKGFIPDSGLEIIKDCCYVFLSPTNTTPPLGALAQNGWETKALKKDEYSIYALGFYLSILEFCADRYFVIGSCAGIHALAYYHSIDLYGLENKKPNSKKFIPEPGFKFLNGGQYNVDPLMNNHELAYFHSTVAAIGGVINNSEYEQHQEINDIFGDEEDNLPLNEHHKYFISNDFPSITFREHTGMILNDSMMSLSQKQLIPIGEMHGSWFSGYQDHPHYNFNLSVKQNNALDERFGLHRNQHLTRHNGLIRKRIRKKFYDNCDRVIGPGNKINTADAFSQQSVGTRNLPNLKYVRRSTRMCKRVDGVKTITRYKKRSMSLRDQGKYYREMYKSYKK